MLKIEIRDNTPSDWKKLQKRSAYGEDDIEYGELRYMDDTENGGYKLDYLQATVSKQQIGRRLLQDFVVSVGIGVQVNGQITNFQTEEWLRKHSYFLRAKQSGSFSIVEQSELMRLPIVRVLSYGNIRTIRFDVLWNPLKEKTNIDPKGMHFWGVTR